MSKSVGDVLREMDAKATEEPWEQVAALHTGLRAFVDGPANVAVASTYNGANSRPGEDEANAAMIVALRNALPLLAAVLDAADAMEEQHPHAQQPFDHDVFGVAAYRMARAALAEALKEGR